MGYTREQLINNLLALKQELNRSPRYVECKKPDGRTYAKVFGSFQNALTEAGIEVSYRKYTREDLEFIILSKYKELGRLPSIKEISQRSPILLEFGTYSEAIRACGLMPTRKQTNSEMIDSLKGYAKELGHTPTFREALDTAPFCAHNFCLRFGSWNKALAEAGIEYNMEVIAPKISKEEFLTRYIEYSNMNEHLLTSKEIDVLFKGDCKSSSVRTWFYSMTKLKQLASKDPRITIATDNIRLEKCKYTRREIEDILAGYFKRYPERCSLRCFKDRIKEFDISYPTICSSLEINSADEFWNYIEGMKKSD